MLRRQVNPTFKMMGWAWLISSFFCLQVIFFDLAKAQEARSIWDETISPQPFEPHSFQSIRVPSWVENTLGCGYTMSVMSSEQRAAAARHGVTISEMGFVDPFFAYYDSKLLKRHSPHVPPDRLKKDMEEYKKLGVRILGVYPPCLQSEVYELHPEWRRIATNTREIPQVDLKQAPHGGMLCLLGPYGDFFVSVLEEIVTQFPEVDAFSFDGLHYGGVCYCDECRKGYREATGKEIPNVSMEDPEFRRYQHWADRKMEGLVQRMQTRLKRIKPDIALVTWSTNAGRFGHFLSVPRNMPSRMNLLLDAPDQEFWLDETNRGATIVPAVGCAYIWATTNHRVAFSEPYLLSHGNPYGKDSFPPHEIERRMLLAATYGCAPSIAVAQPKSLQDELYKVMDKVQARKPWLIQKSPEPWAGILLSDNTRNFYGRDAGQVEQRYMASIFGTFRACVEEHLPFQIINDWNLNPKDLSKFAVIVLPNAASLDEHQVEALKEYVKAGGGLVASLDASLCDEYGDRRRDFALQDLLGVSYKGIVESDVKKEADIDINFAATLPADYWDKRKNVFDLRLSSDAPWNHGRMQAYVGEEAVTMKGPAVRVIKSADSMEWGTMQVKGVSGATHPAVIARKLEGDGGKTVFFAAGVDNAYYTYSFPYQRLMIADSIRWAARHAPPVVIKAPMCVHSTLMRQDLEGKQRLVLHLFNDINTTAFHALPNEDVPLREETLPIHDIEVKFDAKYKVLKATWEPDGAGLVMQVNAKGTKITVPKLDVHGMVVVDLLDEKVKDR